MARGMPHMSTLLVMAFLFHALRFWAFRRAILVVCCGLLAGGALSTSARALEALSIYDELADANRDVAAAVKQATNERKLVLLVFGANWCPDCRAFDDDMNAADLGSTLAEYYVVVKIDVARFKKNLDVARRYGVPIRLGIPATAIVSGDDKTLVVADGRKMEELRATGRPGVVKFYEAAFSAQANASTSQ